MELHHARFAHYSFIWASQRDRVPIETEMKRYYGDDGKEMNRFTQKQTIIHLPIAICLQLHYCVRISFYRMSLVRRWNRAAASINGDVQTESRTFDIFCTCRWNWFVCVFPFALAVEWLHRSIYVWALEMLQQHHPTQDFGARLIVYEIFHVDTLLRQRYRNFIVYAINAEAASNQVLRTFTYLLCTGVTMFLWLHWTYRFLPLHPIYAFSCFLKFGSIACARLRRIIE